MATAISIVFTFALLPQKEDPGFGAGGDSLALEDLANPHWERPIYDHRGEAFRKDLNPTGP
jgi:hypothetical protein